MSKFDSMYAYIKRCYEQGRPITDGEAAEAIFLIMEKINEYEEIKKAIKENSEKEAQKNGQPVPLTKISEDSTNYKINDLDNPYNKIYVDTPDGVSFTFKNY